MAIGRKYSTPRTTLTYFALPFLLPRARVYICSYDKNLTFGKNDTKRSMFVLQGRALPALALTSALMSLIY